MKSGSHREFSVSGLVHARAPTPSTIENLIQISQSHPYVNNCSDANMVRYFTEQAKFITPDTTKTVSSRKPNQHWKEEYI